MLQDAPFSEAAKKREYFFSNKQTYMEDPPCPPKKKPPTPERNRHDHDMAFKPPFAGKSGKHATFEKFPDWKADPRFMKTERKKPDEDEDQKPGFKSPHKYKSIPCASVACNVRNLKSNYPSLFRSPVRR